MNKKNESISRILPHTKTKLIFYLSIIRDLYDNSIIAYKTGIEQNIQLVLDTLREAMRKEKVSGICNSAVTKDFSTLSPKHTLI